MPWRQIQKWLNRLKPAAPLADRRRTGSLEALFEASPLPQVLLSLDDSSLLRANAAFYRLTGLSATTTGLQDILFPRPDIRERFFKELRQNEVVQAQEWEVACPTPDHKKWLLLSGCETRFEGREAVLISLVDLSAQKKAETELRRTNAFQEALLTGTPDPVVYSDLDGLITGYNRAFVRVAGITNHQWIGENLSVFIPPDKLKHYLKANVSLSRADLELSFGSDRSLPVEFLVSRGRVKNPDGKGEGWVFILRDITELKVVERQLKERDRLFKGLAEASGALLSLQGRPEAIHKALGSLGRSVEIRKIFLFKINQDRKTGIRETVMTEAWAADGTDFLATYHDTSVALVRFGDQLLTCLDTGLPLNFEINQLPDPVILQICQEVAISNVLVLPLLMENQPWGFLALEPPEGDRAWTQNEQLILSGFATTLISFIHQAELAQKEKESRAYLTAVINNVAGNIWAINTNYFYTVFNSSFHQIFLENYRHDLQTGDNAAALMSLDESNFWLPLYTRVFGGEKVTIERKYPNGVFEQSLSPIYQADGSISGAVAFSKDISARTEVEEELRAAKESAESANRAKSEFLANMSHEIRTPLNIVLGFADILGNTLTDTVQKNYVESIRTSGRNLLLIINDILDLSKIEAGKMKLERTFVDIRAVTEEVVRIFSLKASENNVAVRVKANFEDRILFSLDEVRFRQILFNLVGNAVKFTPNGSIEIQLESSDVGEVGLKNLQIAVRDTGIGIKDSAIDFIFDSFRQQDNNTTKNYGGTGLGLSITKRLVTMMEGTISVVSQEGLGSTFTITLPRVLFKHTSSDDKQRPPRERISFRGARILLVEDNEVNHLVIKEILRHNDVRITEADNGVVALECLEKEPADLILMDIRMAKMDGYETARWISQDPDWDPIPLIALTALAGTEDREKILQGAFDAYLSKPIDQKRLLDTLCEFLPFDRIPLAATTVAAGQASPASGEPGAVTDSQLSDLENRFLPLLQTALKSKNLSKMERSVTELAAWAEAAGLVFWIDWCRHLLGAIKAFSLTAVEDMLADFPKAVKKHRLDKPEERKP